MSGECEECHQHALECKCALTANECLMAGFHLNEVYRRLELLSDRLSELETKVIMLS